jgi:hypothetical protein
MDPTPIPVPDGLRGLPEEAIDALRRLRLELEELSGLDERTIELTRIGALVALGRPTRSEPTSPAPSPAGSARRRSGGRCSRWRPSSVCRG